MRKMGMRSIVADQISSEAMPELPEVETVCRTMRSVLLNTPILEAEVVEDDIVFGKTPTDAIRAAFDGAMVTAVGRKGKYWWLQLHSGTYAIGHLGMAGWIRQVGVLGARLLEQGGAPLDDENGRARFLKLRLKTAQGEVVFTDGRRLARMWLAETAESDPTIQKLGPDAREALPSPLDFQKKLQKRNAPIKSLLMDQALLSGIGNWIADEVLYRAGIAPTRLGSSITDAEAKKLCIAIPEIIEFSISVGADHTQYPDDWLFNHRWGGSKGKETIGGEKLERITVGGRTTAWVPSRQK